MSTIADNIKSIKREIQSPNVQLIAVSKTKPNFMIQEAYDCGQVDFGENKVQELTSKYDELPKDIRWHMIGHLQRNKVKYIAPFIYLVHSVDSIRLLKEINKEGEKNQRRINCLLQVHIAEEETKYGFDKQELIDLFESADLQSLEHIKITGLMGMATLTENSDQIRKEFSGLKKLFNQLANTYQYPNVELKELSMGMSNDYPIAMDCGSTMVRVGSSIFGSRGPASLDEATK